MNALSKRTMPSATEGQEGGTGDRCPCGDEPASVIMRGGKGPIARCGVCGLFVRAPLPSPQELTQWYRDGYWEKYHAEQTSSARQNLYVHVLDWLAKLRPSRGTLVDVGCGGGAFLAACQAAGWRGIGFDPSTQAVAYAQSLGIQAHVQSWPPCPLGDETVEAVTFVNVLDHLRDPFGAMREAWRVLRPQGALYIRVLNGPFHVGSLPLLSALRLGHLAVFHLFGFSRPVFLHHLPRLGFTVVTAQTSPPSSGDAYGRSGGWTDFVRRCLKVADQGGYRLLNRCGLGRMVWGPSLEVMAYKASPIAASPSGHDGTKGGDPKRGDRYRAG